MLAGQRVISASASSSRAAWRTTGKSRVQVSRRFRHVASATPSTIAASPDSPLLPRNKGKGKRREDIRYEIGGAGQSNECQAYFQKIDGVESDGALGADWIMDGEEVVEGLEPGRVVECRRQNDMTIGLVLANILIAGRARLLLLVTSGEIWPVSPQDVQFAMPASLVPPNVADRCWSPEILAAWQEGHELELDPNGPVLEARRKAVRTLRKVSKETEKMCGRILGQAQGQASVGIGGIEGVWSKWTSDGRTNITAAECAEYLLSDPENTEAGKPIKVRKNTLPAYAAHVLMMDRPDLFLADAGEMWKSGDFLLRSPTERDRFVRVQNWFDGSASRGKEVVDGFTAKAKAAIACRQALESSSSSTSSSGATPVEYPQDMSKWTNDELDIIAVLLTRIYEVRATQQSPTIPLSYLIMKAVNVYPGVQIDQSLVDRFLRDIGMLHPDDSLERGRVIEADRRSIAMRGLSGKVYGPDDLLSGTELDDLREDFTGQTVYVVDDASASELDDGISIERASPSGEDVWVHVHVADPTRYLRPDHPTALRASFQGSSIYTPEGNVPLLPLDVTMRQLSLGADVGGQGVMTFSALISPDGEVKDQKVRMGWIKSPRVITYAAVNDALELTKAIGTQARPFGMPSSSTSDADADEPVSQTKSAIHSEDVSNLRILHRIATNHRKRRFAQTGMEWYLPYGSLRIESPLASPPADVFDPASLPPSPRMITGKPDIDYAVPSPTSTTSFTMTAQHMIAECMILAGTVASSFCHAQGIPAPFRGSATPRPITALRSDPGSSKILGELLARRDDFGTIDPFTLMRANLFFAPGELSTTVIPHWVMGLTQPNTGYLRATSPLRRFDDLLVHWQIKSHLAATSRSGLKTPWPAMLAEEVLSLGTRSDMGQKRIKRASLNANKWWFTRLIASRLEGPVTSSGGIDLREPLSGKVSGVATLPRDQMVSYPVYIPSIANTVDLTLPRGTDLPIGQDVQLKIVSANLYPTPIVEAILAQ